MRRPPKPKAPHPRAYPNSSEPKSTSATQGRIDAGLTVRGIEVDPISRQIPVLVGEPDQQRYAIDQSMGRGANDQANQERPAKTLRVQHRPAR